jgi:diadenosine tetraphosphate (Ap4A) HIT family hydrolase
MNNSEQERRIIIANSEVQVNLFFGADPLAIGHIVVQPRNAAHDISELTGENWRSLSIWIPRVASAMKKVLRKVTDNEIEKIYLCSFNESRDYTVHFHLIPRYRTDKFVGPELLYDRSSNRITVSSELAENIVKEMRKEFGAKYDP